MSKLIASTFRGLGRAGLFLMKGHVLQRKSGAELHDIKQAKDYLSSRNTGLLVDGQNLRLSERESFQNVCFTARVGAGKTTRYIVPNVLDKAKQKCSMVMILPATFGHFEVMQRADFQTAQD